MVNLERIKLTEAERRLVICVKALKQIANPERMHYHKMVDEQVRLAKEALAEIKSGASPEAGGANGYIT